MEAHEAYINEMVPVINEKNILLHQFWLLAAKKAKYIGKYTLAKDSHEIKAQHKFHMKRLKAIHNYSFAIPNEPSLDLIAKFGPIIEIGAGTGYWAYLLANRGVDIIAIDNNNEKGNVAKYFSSMIIDDGEKYLKNHNGCYDRSLFICWPRYIKDFIDSYLGTTVIWIGEVEGCTDDMEDNLEWQETHSMIIPTWLGIHDILKVFKRSSQ